MSYMLNVCYRGIEKMSSEEVDELAATYDDTEWTCSLAAVSLLENMAPICKDSIV
jgi:hypothetical protein